MKFLKVGNGPMNKWLNFGGDLDHGSGYGSGSVHDSAEVCTVNILSVFVSVRQIKLATPAVMFRAHVNSSSRSSWTVERLWDSTNTHCWSECCSTERRSWRAALAADTSVSQPPARHVTATTALIGWRPGAFLSITRQLPAIVSVHWTQDLTINVLH